MIRVTVEIESPDDERVLVISKDAEYDSTEQIWLQVWNGKESLERTVVSEFEVTKSELLDALNALDVIEA